MNNNLILYILWYGKKMDDINSLTTFGRYAVNAFNNRGYIGAIISGEFAKGKTTSAFHMAREILQFVYGIDRMTAFRKILNEHLLFTLKDVLFATDMLKDEKFWNGLTTQEVLEWKYKIRKPVMIWDDAGIHGSKYKHWLDMKDASSLQESFDTIRDITSCFIITVPENDELLSFIRNYRGNYHVEIKHSSGGKYNRVLEFWKYETDSKTGRRIRRKKWRTKPFSVYIEKEIYGEYDRMRTVAKIRNTKRVKERIKTLQSKKDYHEVLFKLKKIQLQKELKKLKEEGVFV